MKLKFSFSLLIGIYKICRIGILFFAVFVLSLNVHAQVFERLSNPQISIHLTHPPGLGLTIKKVAFGPSTGDCADQITEALITDFNANNIEVVDREHLNTILSEHALTLNGSQFNSVALGKLIGPSVLISVKVLRCATDQKKLYDKETKYDSRTKSNYLVYAYISKTTAFLKVSVQTTDLTTGRIFAAQTLNYAPEQSNKSYDGQPEFPSTFSVQDMAFRAAVYDVHKMYLPWGEGKKLYFFDDKEFSLKQAFHALKGNDLDKAFELSKQNLEECNKDGKAKDKIRAHANYNLGMCYMLQSDYNSALKYFNVAKQIKSGNIITDAIADCQKGMALQQSLQGVEERSSHEDQKNQAEEEKTAQTEKANTLTNKSIIDMVKLKLSDAIIIQKIKLSKCNFDTSPTALSALTKAGVKDKVVMAMMEKQ